MLLDTRPTIKNIVAVKIIKICYPAVYVQTEDHHYLELQLSDQEINDAMFWETMRDLSAAKLWIPMGRNYHQLLAYDWVVPAELVS